MKTIYYYGSLRREKVIPAIETNYSITGLTDSLNNLPIAIKQIISQPPSLLIIDTPTGISGTLAMIASMKNVPYAVRLRGGMWNKLRDKHDWNILLKTFKFNIRNLILKKAKAIITVSEFQRKQVSAKLGKNKLPPMKTIYNIVHPEKGSAQSFRNKLCIPRDKKIILTVTSFSTYKKYAGILDFSSPVLETLEKNKDWIWVIIGRGYAIKPVRDKLQLITPDLLTENRVIFSGHYEPIWDAYAASNILVQMSFRETMGNPLLEAQAVGKIALCNNFGGMPELVRKEFVYHNQTELWHKLNHFINMNVIDRIALGNKLKKDMELFSKEHLSEPWRIEIEKILGDN
jgi:glycosyltransferase involved in cell wall biosynthesis